MRAPPLLAALALAAAGCHPDPGVPDYSAMDQLFDAGPGSGSLPGPDPYVVGSRRLAFGIFYDGAYSELLTLADATRHYYIYQASGANTYTQEVWADRRQGNVADRLTIPVGTPGWWGGAITYDTPVDLSSWTTLHVSLKSSDPSFSEIEIRTATDPAAQVAVRATAYGWVADNEWHELVIPLSRFAGVNFASLRIPFGLGNPASVTVHAGQALIVDNLYFD